MPYPGAPCPSLKWQQIQKHILERTLGTLIRGGVNPLSTPFLSLQRSGDYINLNLGFKVPRPMTFILKLFGLSPGELKLWFDAESGWMTEARARPGAPPVYKSASDKIAITIIKEELTHEQFEELMTPDPYIGE